MPFETRCALLAPAGSFDDRAYLESGAFVQELLAAGRTRGVHLDELDGQVVSYPSLVRVLANECRRDRQEAPQGNPAVGPRRDASGEPGAACPVPTRRVHRGAWRARTT